MSGHSKWSTIKHKKAATDAKRGKLFTRLAREIAVAAREGGSSLDTNFNLRLAVDRAKSANMPKDNIERAVKRGTGELKGEELLELMYEGYAPHGVALLVKALTDNKNRTIAELRSVLNRQGGAMAEAGAVSWQFDRQGYIGITPDGADEDRIFEVAVEAGAADVVFSDDLVEVYAAPEDFQGDSDAAYPERMYPGGANFWVRRSTCSSGINFDDLAGPRPTGFKVMGTETSFLHKLASNGHRIMYSPDAVVGHHVQRQLFAEDNIKRRAFRWGRQMPHRGICHRGFFQKHPVLWRLMRVMSLVRHAVKYAVAKVFFPRDRRMAKSLDLITRMGYDLESLKISYGNSDAV